MNADSHANQPNEQAAPMLKKFLGSLELEVMDIMWQAGEATVRQVTKVLNERRPTAYTTVMTVMSHLVNKGLLSRSKEGKRYRYHVARSRDRFLQEVSSSMIRSFVEDFGDLAIAQFLGEVDRVDAERLRHLRNLAREANGTSNASG